MKLLWRPLEPGEPIGVVALSGPVNAKKLAEGLAVLRAWGHPVIEAPNLRIAESYLAGSDAQRVAGLEEVLEAGARFVIAARGGYGATRLLPHLPLKRMAERDVTLIGFSDLTAILNPLATLGGAPQIHGPMVAAGLSRSGNAERLRWMLRESAADRTLFDFAKGSVARHGRAIGKVVGGNLSLLASLLGTPWEPDFNGCLLFLEEVGEPLYRLDRMLTHLRGSGRLQQVKALIGGSLHECRPAGERSELWRRLLLETAPEGAPVVIGLPFGHGARNLAFPIGAVVELDTRRRRLAWR